MEEGVAGVSAFGDGKAAGFERPNKRGKTVKAVAKPTNFAKNSFRDGSWVTGNGRESRKLWEKTPRKKAALNRM
jgi:hypothetical protein